MEEGDQFTIDTNEIQKWVLLEPPTLNLRKFLPRFVPQTEKPIYREDYSLEDSLKRERYEADLRNEFIDWIMQQFMENQDG